MHTAIPTGQPGRTDLSARFSRVLRRILALDAAYRDARRLAEAQGGSLTVENYAGGGAVFSLVF